MRLYYCIGKERWEAKHRCPERYQICKVSNTAMTPTAPVLGLVWIFARIPWHTRRWCALPTTTPSLIGQAYALDYKAPRGEHGSLREEASRNGRNFGPPANDLRPPLGTE